MIFLATLAAAFMLLFLLGILIIAVIVRQNHGDPSASYKLFAVRDRLVASVVLNGLSRDDPWLKALYHNVNAVLIHSNLIAGPDGWPFAKALGEFQAQNTKLPSALLPLPSEESCPEEIKEIGPSMREALTYLLNNHMGFHLQFDAKRREERRIQKKKARQLLEMMNSDSNSHCLSPT